MRIRIVVGALCAVGAAVLSIDGSVSAQSNVCDFVTGGGYILPQGSPGPKGTFAASGGCKDGSFWGDLVYQDERPGKQIQSTTITAYKTAPENARLICGTGRTAQGTANFVARVKDGGEPGTFDEFDIQWDSATEHFTTFGTGFPHKHVGGNSQLHRPNSSNAGNFGGTCPAIAPPQQAADVSVIKTTQTPAPAFASGVSYNILVQNVGNAGATNIMVTDNLPRGPSQTLNWLVTPAVTGCSISDTQTLTCTFATLAAGASKTIHVETTLVATDCGPAPPNAVLLTNVATVSAANQGVKTSDPAVITLPACAE